MLFFGVSSLWYVGCPPICDDDDDELVFFAERLFLPTVGSNKRIDSPSSLVSLPLDHIM